MANHGKYRSVIADLDNLRSAAGSLDDVRKLARRYSIELGGQQVAAFQNGTDQYLLAPIKNGRNGRPIVLDEVSGLIRENPEARFVTGPDGGIGSGIRPSYESRAAGLDPSRAAQRLRVLQRQLDAPVPEHITKLQAQHDANVARIAAIDTELEHAGLRERMALRKERRSLEYATQSSTWNLTQDTRAYERERTALETEFEEVSTFVERFQLPEREEWVALAGFANGTPRLRELAQAEPGVAYEELVRAARESSFRTDTTAGVVLRANDGTLWTGTFDASPDDVLKMAQLDSRHRYASHDRPTAAMRAISGGGRTVQWTDTGDTTLA
jgi:hypothetical protein